MPATRRAGPPCSGATPARPSRSKSDTASGEAVTKDQLQRFCDQKVPALRGCSSGSAYAVTFTISGDGDVTHVKAYDDGKVDDHLTSCSTGKLKGRFGPQPGGKTTDFKCKVE